MSVQHGYSLFKKAVHHAITGSKESDLNWFMPSRACYGMGIFTARIYLIVFRNTCSSFAHFPLDLVLWICGLIFYVIERGIFRDGIWGYIVIVICALVHIPTN